ncbi:MAG TPA: hypothetical protein VE869_07375 [Gemmatimonas sp.]|nr:hypothetical protein [Gemmatimonas sp.]
MTSALSSPRLRPRRGRLLIECLVSLLLLSAAAAALGASTRALALLADDAVLVARAHTIGSTLAERAHWQACTTGVTVINNVDRVQVDALSVGDSVSLRTNVAATISPSPLARRTPRTLSMSTGRICP